MSGYYRQQQYIPPQPPPLPPRNHTPPEHGSYGPTYSTQYGALPPPPPLPRRKPVPVPGLGAPPIPPRPPGYGSPATGPNAYAGQGYTQMQPALSNPHTAQSLPPQATAPGHDPCYSNLPSATVSGPDTTLYSIGNTLESLSISDTHPQSSNQPTYQAYRPPPLLQQPLALTANSSSNPEYPQPPSQYSLSEPHYPAPPVYHPLPPSSDTSSHTNTAQAGSVPEPAWQSAPTIHEEYAQPTSVFVPPAAGIPPDSTGPLGHYGPSVSHPVSPGYGSPAGTATAEHTYPSAPDPGFTTRESYKQQPAPSNEFPQQTGYASVSAYTVPPPPPPQPLPVSVPAVTAEPVSVSPPQLEESPLNQIGGSTAELTPRQEPRGWSMFDGAQADARVTACIDTPMSFPTTWYTHPSAPGFFICSWCYLNRIHPTRFRNDFVGKFLDDEEMRECLFKRPQMEDALFKEATSTGSLHRALDWMQRRPLVPRCKGTGGGTGKEGIKWYATKGKVIPGFVVCEACYEDVCLSNSFASNMELATGAQGEHDVWFCDMALPYVRMTYIETGKTGNWAGFVSEAKARMAIPVCPKATQAFGALRAWFRPKSRDPGDLLICGACYCDYVAYGPDPHAWERATELNQRYTAQPTCSFGHFNFLTAMLRAIEVKDSFLFWGAIREAFREPFCDGKGMANATWYTLPSHSSGLDMCGQCYAAVLKPLNIGHLFVQRANLAPGEVRLCNLNTSNGRFVTTLNKVLEAFYLQDTSRLERWAIDYADTPVCGRDADFNDRQWYGWAECTICPECYASFVRGTALADTMPLKKTLIKEPSLCEMYSPRMRKLYLQACETGDPAQLLEYSVMRRGVYFETVPACRMMLLQAKMNLERMNTLNMVSLTYTHMGGLQDAVSNHRYLGRYGDSSVGYGYDNMNSYQGAAYLRQASSLSQSSSTQNAYNSISIGELERRWREVE